MADRDAYIVSACRTAIGEFMGGLGSMTAPQLGAIAVRDAVRRAAIDPGQIDEVLMGNVVQAGVGQAPARQAAIHGGIPDSVPAMTVNKVCGSGLKAVMLAAQAIRAGDAELGSVRTAGPGRKTSIKSSGNSRATADRQSSPTRDNPPPSTTTSG